MEKELGMKALIMTGFLVFLISCQTQSSMKTVNDFQNFNPNFKLDKEFGLKTDGVYVAISGPYQEVFTPEEFDRKFNRSSVLKSDHLIPTENKTYTYYAYEVLAFCEVDGSYLQDFGYDFDAEKLTNYQHYIKENICGKRFPNFYFRIQNDEIKLEHFEWRQNTKVKLNEVARVAQDTLYYKKHSSDWSKKRTEKVFIFHPY